MKIDILHHILFLLFLEIDDMVSLFLGVWLGEYICSTYQKTEKRELDVIKKEVSQTWDGLNNWTFVQAMEFHVMVICFFFLRSMLYGQSSTIFKWPIFWPWIIQIYSSLCNVMWVGHCALNLFTSCVAKCNQVLLGATL